MESFGDGVPAWWAEERRLLIREGGAAPAGAMARHLWLASVHVALFVIDEVMDLPRTRERTPARIDRWNGVLR